MKKLFNKVAATIILSGSLMGFAQAEKAPVETTKPAALCEAFPDFKKPEIPMHRISRNIDADTRIEERQDLLAVIGLPTGRSDGRMGVGTRIQMREFLILYGPLFGSTDFNRDLNASDTESLREFATRAKADAKTYKLSTASAAALRLASLRTGVRMDRLADADGSPLVNETWLYLIKTRGADYGLGFFADHITLTDKAISVDNPFVHRQILELKKNPRLDAVMSAEYMKNAGTIPLFDSIPKPSFTAEALEEQEALQTLGFNIGGAPDGIKGTYHTLAIKEFQLLHGHGRPTGILNSEEHASLLRHAAKARSDAANFGVPSVAAGAIRMASDKNDFDFGYMMELASAESGFAHAIKADTSSATGLYQFIESTWHTMIKGYGANYGLGSYAGQVELYVDDYGRDQARVNNPFIRAGIVELRKHPHLSSLIGTNFQHENETKEKCFINGQPSRTDMYLAHFLGAHDAVYFINAQQQNPARSAVATFPEAAEYNINVFYQKSNGKIVRERSLSEVYNFFDKKFHRGVFDDAAAPKVRVVPPAVKAAPTAAKKATVAKPVKKKVKKAPPPKSKKKKPRR